MTRPTLDELREDAFRELEEHQEAQQIADRTARLAALLAIRPSLSYRGLRAMLASVASGETVITRTTWRLNGESISCSDAQAYLDQE